jgi:hypothetical protein
VINGVAEGVKQGLVNGVEDLDRDLVLARLAEASLAQDWNRPEEEAAWAHLKPGP